MLSQTVWSIKSNNTCSIKYLWNLGIFSQTLLNRPSQLADRDWQGSDIDEKSCTVLFFQKDYLCLKKLLLYPHKQSWRGALKSPCQSLCRHSFVPNTNFLTAAWNSVYIHVCYTSYDDVHLQFLINGEPYITPHDLTYLCETNDWMKKLCVKLCHFQLWIELCWIILNIS